MDEKTVTEENRVDVYSILNKFAVAHNLIDEFGSYENSGETLYQSDSVQDNLVDLVADLYDCLQLSYDERVYYAVKSYNEGVDNDCGFNAVELANIINREKEKE